MEVGNDEVSVGNMHVETQTGEKQPGEAADVNRPMKPNAYSMGVANTMEPLYKVAVQLKTFTAEGIATK